MTLRRKGLALVLAAMMLLASSATVLAQGTAQVTIDGQLMTFDQPPIIRNGRVLVPMRGIFERLGATVVYDAATRSIRATDASGQPVMLTLGSSMARVGGQQVFLDVPAQALNGRTLVPLRFVSEALGADVAWQPLAKTVVIETGAMAGPPPVSPPPVSMVVENTVAPAPGSIAGTLTPTIRATFADPLDTATIRFTVDGQDVTNRATISSREVSWTPNYQLASGSHQADVSAQTAGGTPIRANWGFVLNPGTVSGYQIYSIQLGPDRPLARGETLLVTMQGVENGTATFDLAGMRGLPMREVRPGIYEGTYTVTARDQVDATVVVNLTGPDGRTTSLQADERAALFGNPALR